MHGVAHSPTSARATSIPVAHAQPSPGEGLSKASLRLQKEAASFLAETLVSDAVTFAIEIDGRSLRKLAGDVGLDVAYLSRLASGKNCRVSSLARLALSLDKKLHISIE